MKTEHRHELKTNDLSKVAVEVESFYERHATSLQWGIIAVAFLAACGIYYWRTNAAIESAGWNELAQSNSTDEFARVAADYSGSRAAPWAKLREANGYLRSGLYDAFENREKSNTDLNKAKSILTDLAKQGGPRELRQQVLFALARSLEMTSDGDLKPAIDAYENLLKTIPDTDFKDEAERRIKELGSNEAKEFYAFFSKQNPKPAEPPKPNDSKAGTGKGASADAFEPLSSGLKSLQNPLKDDGGDLSLPSPLNLPDATGEDAKTPDEKAPATEKPAEPEKKTEEVPATKDEAKPEAPAAESKPTDAPPEKKAE